LKSLTDRQRNDPIPFSYQPGQDETADNVPTSSEAKWLSDAVIYQWDDDFGEIGPHNPELEKVLFEDDNLQRAGEAIKALSYEVETEGPEKIHPVRDVSVCSGGCLVCLLTITQFHEAGLHPTMLENVKLCRYNHPTPIQSYCIPAVLTGHDVVAVAQTGMFFLGSAVRPY
jgi:ATP-dependent RNA helicase DDX3X